MKLNNKKGQALVEYVIIIGLISVLAVALVSYFGGYLKDAITKASCPLVGEAYEKGEKIGEGTCVESDTDLIDSMFGN
jgi:Flp pilus assembly pilin Flp